MIVDHAPGEGAHLTALLLHPHPDMGGDRFNHVVDALYCDLPPRGLSALRFDFGSADPEAALIAVQGALTHVQTPHVAVVGYSFGADMALHSDDSRVVAWCAVAPPLHFGDFATVAGDLRPKLLVVPGDDQFSPPERVRPRVAGWSNTTVEVIDDADHFLHGATAAVVGLVADWLTGLAP